MLGDLVNKAFPSPSLICPVEYGNTGLDSIHFFWGSKNSGAPLHIHADAINLVVHGEKKWFVYPPLQSLYSRKHISRWLAEDYAKMNDEERPLECTQRAGTHIYLIHTLLYSKLTLHFRNAIRFSIFGFQFAAE
jgi:hypothetical protein